MAAFVPCSAAVIALSANNGSGPSASALESTLVDNKLLALLEAVHSGQLQPSAAALQLRERSAGYQQVCTALKTSLSKVLYASHYCSAIGCSVQVLDFAQVDSWRSHRTGFPEVVMGQGKSPEQIAAIMKQLALNEQMVMATRISEEVGHHHKHSHMALSTRLASS